MADSSSGRQVYPSKVCRQRSVYSLEKKSEEEEGKEQGEIRKQKKNKKFQNGRRGHNQLIGLRAEKG